MPQDFIFLVSNLHATFGNLYHITLPCTHGWMEVVGAALDGARHRRERLVAMQGMALSTPATPDTGRAGLKRNLKTDVNPSSASTAASSTAKGDVEKVTPDPKHVRVSTAPTPKELFASLVIKEVKVWGDKILKIT